MPAVIVLLTAELSFVLDVLAVFFLFYLLLRDGTNQNAAPHAIN